MMEMGLICFVFFVLFSISDTKLEIVPLITQVYKFDAVMRGGVTPLTVSKVCMKKKIQKTKKLSW